MQAIADRKKVAIFGLLGIVGCLVGWGAGEGLLASVTRTLGAEEGAPPTLVSKPAPLSALSGPDKPVAAPAPLVSSGTGRPTPPPPAPELQERLDRERAKTGDVQISLYWEDYNDVDLHCFDPPGNHIFYDNRTSPTGGELDVDMNREGREGGNRSSNKPVENIYWPAGKAPPGKYKVYVHGYRKFDEQNPTPFRLSIAAGGQRKEYEGRVRFGMLPATGELVHVCDFEVGAPTATLCLAVSPQMQIFAGGRNQMQVRVAREGNGAVQLRFRGDVQGLRFPNLTIPAGQSTINVDVHAEENAAAGQRIVSVKGSIDPATQAESAMAISVVAIPSGLRLSVPDLVEVRQGGDQVMQVLVARDRVAGPVQLRWASDASHVTLPSLTIPADRDSVDVAVHAPVNAEPGRHPVILKAECGPSRQEASVNFSILPRVAAGIRFRSILVVGGWTALLAIFLALALVIGQNAYLKRALLQIREGGIVVAGGVVAGLVAGGTGELLAQLLGGARVLPQVGAVAGWLLLGALLGRGVTFFVPNLSGWRSTLAGACGGLFGGMVFVALSFVQEGSGRFAGAAILGLAIGLTIPLVEQFFRQAWLDVRYRSGEAMTVNLGAEPVTIGSDARACTVYARGAAPVAYRYWLKDGSITREDVKTGQQKTLRAGDREEVGVVSVSVVTASQPSLATARPIPKPPPPPPIKSPARTGSGVPLKKSILAPPPPGAAPLNKPIPPPPPPPKKGN